MKQLRGLYAQMFFTFRAALVKDTQVCFPVALVGNDFSSASVRQDVAQGHLIQ
jgi:hypothetical protein